MGCGPYNWGSIRACGTDCPSVRVPRQPCVRWAGAQVPCPPREGLRARIAEEGPAGPRPPVVLAFSSRRTAWSAVLARVSQTSSARCGHDHIVLGPGFGIPFRACGAAVSFQVREGLEPSRVNTQGNPAFPAVKCFRGRKDEENQGVSAFHLPAGHPARPGG